MSTVLLQKNDFTLSDFFGCIQVMDMKLAQMIASRDTKFTTLASSLQTCLNERKRRLLENPLSLCAKILDPHKCEIDRDPEKLRFVEITLQHLCEKMKSAKCGGSVLQVENDEQQTHRVTSIHFSKSSIRGMMLHLV